MSPQSESTERVAGMESECRSIFAQQGQELKFAGHRARTEAFGHEVLVNIESEWTTVLWCERNECRMVQIRTGDIGGVNRAVRPLFESGTTH